MSMPTGHQTLSYAQAKRLGEAAWKRLWDSTREGDVYLDKRGMHWVCLGDMTGKTDDQTTGVST